MEEQAIKHTNILTKRFLLQNIGALCALTAFIYGQFHELHTKVNDIDNRETKIEYTVANFIDKVNYRDSMNFKTIMFFDSLQDERLQDIQVMQSINHRELILSHPIPKQHGYAIR